jgi:pentatricopeptide repeat domain-containing protein 1
MSTRVPVQQQQHYNLNSPTSFIDSPLHVLNSVDARTAATSIDDITTSGDHDAAVCLPLHSVEVDEDRSSLETNESSRGLYDILTVEGNIL